MFVNIDLNIIKFYFGVEFILTQILSTLLLYREPRVVAAFLAVQCSQAKHQSHPLIFKSSLFHQSKSEKSDAQSVNRASLFSLLPTPSDRFHKKLKLFLNYFTDTHPPGADFIILSF